MSGQVLVGLASIIVLGVLAQWIAWRLRVPSILLLLTAGILAGPVTGFLQPDRLFAHLLLPIVSLSVAVILFEGGLSLRLRELRDIGWVFLRLATIGALVTWLVTAAAARFLLELDWPLAALLGAILVVTGPTVIGPILRHLRLGGQVGAALKWEGIVIDPIGATLAVVVFAAIRAGNIHDATMDVAFHLLKTVLIGGGLGVLAGVLLAYLMSRYWIPDHLHNPVALAAIFAVFTGANLPQKEAGLLAVTVMGVWLANQKGLVIKHLVEFKENLSLLLVSSLFIILAGRLRRADLVALDLPEFLFLGVVILVARPAAVLLSTLRSTLNWREKLFLGWMAPRGIVAASVSSVFALEIAAAGFAQADRLPPITFLVVVGTVAIYGLSAAPLARWLELARPNPQGVLLVGAHPWARAVAAALKAEGCTVLLADSNWDNIRAARMAGLPTYYGSILSEHALDEIDLSGLGRLLAVTSNDEVNALACLRFTEFFGRREVYQLPPEAGYEGRQEAMSLEQRGRFLFGPGITASHLHERFGDNPSVKTTRLTREFDYDAFLAHHGERVLPVFLIRENGQVAVFMAESLTPQPGQVLISLVAQETGALPSATPPPAGQTGSPAPPR